MAVELRIGDLSSFRQRLTLSGRCRVATRPTGYYSISDSLKRGRRSAGAQRLEGFKPSLTNRNSWSHLTLKSLFAVTFHDLIAPLHRPGKS
ncbi:hypothetical protein PGTUg99_000527 [Puccinia graminis f. sp. tritici]|uniref:Uncharacterized protein n=1 Tax=Puccinia graminis f. sp. tritici TaxID=56615 RepID=A0A5B0S289_PUCGR|nr:hypothetical protein PGTUg99_000527 [Puccinia graminis f. sp. tritici]